MRGAVEFCRGSCGWGQAAIDQPTPSCPGSLEVLGCQQSNLEPFLSKLADDIPKNWYTLIVNDGTTLSLPGIYEWKIEGVGSYIGQYKHKYRPTREYERNVFKIATGRAYRPGKPDGFRRIHRELEAAHRDGRAITLIIVENCLDSERNQREAFHIAARGTLNGRVKADSQPILLQGELTR